MAGGQPVPWETCSHDGCVGVRLAAAVWCLAHAAEQDPSAFDAELERIGDEGTVDARGVQLSANLLKRILDAASHQDDRLVLKAAQFTKATFQEAAKFSGASFQDEAVFAEAIFQGWALFTKASFQGDAVFTKAAFRGLAGFDGAGFRGARFDEATFRGLATFDGATFERARQVGPLLAR